MENDSLEKILADLIYQLANHIGTDNVVEFINRLNNLDKNES